MAIFSTSCIQGKDRVKWEAFNDKSSPPFHLHCDSSFYRSHAFPIPALRDDEVRKLRLGIRQALLPCPRQEQKRSQPQIGSSEGRTQVSLVNGWSPYDGLSFAYMS